MNSCCKKCHWYEETKPEQCSGFCSYRRMDVDSSFDCDGFIDNRVELILKSIRYEVHQREGLFKKPVIVLSYYLFRTIQALNYNYYFLSYDTNHNYTLFGIKLRIATDGDLFYTIGDEITFEE